MTRSRAPAPDDARYRQVIRDASQRNAAHRQHLGTLEQLTQDKLSLLAVGEPQATAALANHLMKLMPGYCHAVVTCQQRGTYNLERFYAHDMFVYREPDEILGMVRESIKLAADVKIIEQFDVTERTMSQSCVASIGTKLCILSTQADDVHSVFDKIGNYADWTPEDVAIVVGRLVNAAVHVQMRVNEPYITEAYHIWEQDKTIQLTHLSSEG